MAKLIIEKVDFYDKNKDQQPLLDKNGRPYKKVRITSEGKQYWGFAFQDSPLYKNKVGDEIEVDIDTKEFGGKTYYNFKLVKPTMGDMEKRVRDLEMQVADLYSWKLEVDKGTNFSVAKVVQLSKELPKDFSDVNSELAGDILPEQIPF